MKSFIALALVTALATPAMASYGDAISLYGEFVCLVCLYILPGLVASMREHRQMLAIWMLNILLGWTLLGWVAAMVWACTTSRETAA